MNWRNWLKKELPLGVTWEADGIRVVELEKDSSGYQVKTHYFPLAGDIFKDGEVSKPNLLIEFLQDIRVAHKWGKKKVVTVIPGKEVILRHLQLPSMPSPELAQAVIWEAKQQLDIDADKYSIDYTILGEQTENSQEDLKILLGATPKRVAMDFHDLFAHAGFKLAAIDVVPLALKRALIDTVFAIEPKTAVLLDLGSTYSQLAVVLHGQLSFTRSFSFSLSESGQEEIIGKSKTLFTEIKRTLNYFQAQQREVKVKEIIVSGPGCDWPGLQFMHRDLGLEIEAGVPGHGLSLDQYPDPSFAVPFGLALKGVCH